jgi:ribosomal protein S6--L-glutamate ligase
MKLVVLSRSRSIPSTRRLVDAGRARGHSVRVLAPTEVEVHLDTHGSQLWYRGRRLTVPDAVLPRIAASVAAYGLPVLEQLVLHGAVVLNTARAIGQSRNPVRCLQLLASAGLDIPTTVLARNAQDLKGRLKELGGPPVLVKLLAGTGRRGLMVCESAQSLEAALEAVLGLGHNLVLQEYLRRASRDVRVFVVGGRALAAVSRIAPVGRLSSSLSRHGRLSACELTPRLAEVAQRAAQVCELEVCAVDVLEFRRSVRVFEVNASPALPDMEAVTGVDLATPIIERAEQLLAARGASKAVT